MKIPNPKPHYRCRLCSRWFKLPVKRTRHEFLDHTSLLDRLKKLWRGL